MPSSNPIKLIYLRLRTALWFAPFFGASMMLPAGCSSTPPSAPQQAQPSAPARELRLYLRLDTPGAGTSVIGGAFDAFGAALTQAGYQVVGDEKKADIIVALKISAARETSIMNVTVNGRPPAPKYTLSIMAIFSTTTDRTTLDTVSGSYSTSDDGAAQQESTAMVCRLNASPKLAQYALRQQSDRAARERKEREEAEALSYQAEQEKLNKERAAKEKEEGTWKSANAPGCRTPETLESCDIVRLYLKNYPSGGHAEQARQALAEGESKMAALKLELDWKRLDLESCKSPKASTDCDGVETYLTAAPQGPHAQEARDMLAKSKNKLGQLAKAEEAKTRREAAATDAETKRQEAAQKRQEQLDCQVDCKKNVCSPYALSSKFGLCVARCVQNTCSN